MHMVCVHTFVCKYVSWILEYIGEFCWDGARAYVVVSSVMQACPPQIWNRELSHNRTLWFEHFCPKLFCPNTFVRTLLSEHFCPNTFVRTLLSEHFCQNTFVRNFGWNAFVRKFFCPNTFAQSDALVLTWIGIKKLVKHSNIEIKQNLPLLTVTTLKSTRYYTYLPTYFGMYVCTNAYTWGIRGLKTGKSAGSW
jgi:hypothetical protein